MSVNCQDLEMVQIIIMAKINAIFYCFSYAYFLFVFSAQLEKSKLKRLEFELY